jgi:hypothetical protein
MSGIMKEREKMLEGNGNMIQPGKPLNERDTE